MHTKSTSRVDALAVGSLGALVGIYLGFSVAIVPALARVGDESYLTVFQEINEVIENPVFLTLFMAAPVLPVVATIVRRRNRGSRGFKLWAGAAAVYIVASLIPTMGGNIPLNERLATVDVAASGVQQRHDARVDFEEPWNAWHTVRTVGSVAAFALAVAGAVTRDRKA